jgi:hypothetical protein
MLSQLGVFGHGELDACQLTRNETPSRPIAQTTARLFARASAATPLPPQSRNRHGPAAPTPSAKAKPSG